MGRARKLELIGDEKSRIRTLDKRKKGLTWQLEQLTILCDVPACMIIHDPTTNSTSIWPPHDSDRVRRLIDGCKDPSGVRTYGVSDFFKERRERVEGELLKNLEGMDDCLGSMDEAQLRGLAAALRGKAEAVRSRIEFLKREEESVMMKKISSDSAHIDQDMIFMDVMKKNNLFAYSDSAHIDQDLIFMDVMEKKNNSFDYSDSAHIDQDTIFMDVMKKNNLFAYSDSAHIDQDLIFMDVMKKNSNMFDHSDSAHIDQDLIFVDVMEKKNNLFDYSDSAHIDQDMIFMESAMKKKKKNQFDYSDWAQFCDMINSGGFEESVMMKNDDMMLFDYPELY